MSAPFSIGPGITIGAGIKLGAEVSLVLNLDAANKNF